MPQPIYKEIRWGFIGCGEVTEKKSGPAFNLVPGSRIQAVMSRSKEKASSYAERHNIPRWYTDALQLINDPEVNAIYIATPPSSHATYAIMAMKAGKPVYVEKPLASSYLDCQRIINNQAGMSKSHIRKLTQELKHIFRTAKKNGLIRSNPAEDITPPTGTEGKRRSLTATERYHFLEVTKNKPQYLLFRIMLFCGLRSSEAAEVQFSDVVTIQGVKFFHVRGTKTKAADRLVPIPPELPIGSGEGYVIGERMNKSKYIRRTSHLKRDMNISMGAKLYRNQLIPPLPLADDFTPYILRHTYCTDLKKKGVDLRLAKELMGHSDIRSTADIYDHADDESAVLAAKQMGILQ